MGNHKLRLSNIIPNVWFYKLKAMTTTTNNNKSIRNNHHSTQATNNLDHSIPPPSLRRESYHIIRPLNPKSSRKSRLAATKSSSSSSVSTTCSCATAIAHSSIQSKPASTTTSSSLDNLSLPPELHCFDRMVVWNSASCNGSSSSPVPDDCDNDDDHSDIVIGVDKMSLAPITTQPKKFSELVSEIGAAEEDQTGTHDKPRKLRTSPVRRISTSSSSPGVRIRINSPKLSKRYVQVESNAAARRNLERKSVKSAESVAVVKSSANPERDFRESMVEMIVENEIRAANDLEDLLASYLSLNSVEHHHLIVHVFKQILFGLNQIDYAY